MKKTTLLATLGAAAFLSVACGGTAKPTPDAAPTDGAAPAADAKPAEGSCGGEKKAGEGSCGGEKAATPEAPKN
ncbi:MAG: hypothetical protein Q8O67_12455 [Deltaproteobacteria bacterium]|nr:hypothetical protein [Deltaproteobacteria bacterium]